MEDGAYLEGLLGPGPDVAGDLDEDEVDEVEVPGCGAVGEAAVAFEEEVVEVVGVADVELGLGVEEFLLLHEDLRC